ncbi:MAG: OST-HTH/LOTUS domain-containing protein, partial [Pseudomonadota bacterium]|nr:OST-HTH/LOTUS domain-containing protein [Pseudomonadota bacterium]
VEEVSVSKPKNIKSDTKLIALLRQGIEANEDDDGWADLGAVGSNISNRTSFDCRNYGFKNLSSLFKAIDLFELKRGQDRSYLVRDARRSKKN